MRRRRSQRLIHEGDYVAEVEIDLIETNKEWSPYMSLDFRTLEINSLSIPSLNSKTIFAFRKFDP